MSAERPRIAVVTGAARGIGAAIAALFRTRGWRVLGVDERPAADAAAGEVWLADLSDLDQLDAVVRRITVETGAVDCLVNNAALQVVRRLLDTSAGEFDRVMAVNVRAAFFLMQGLHPLLRAVGGSVVNIASVHATATSSGLAAYVTSKGGLTALTRAAALELADDGIRVNAVLPGAVDTAMLRAGLARMTEPEVNAFAAAHPVGRIGAPSDIAEAVWFLADASRSGFVTGSSITVDGGVTARLCTE